MKKLYTITDDTYLEDVSDYLSKTSEQRVDGFVVEVIVAGSIVVSPDGITETINFKGEPGTYLIVEVNNEE